MAMMVQNDENRLALVQAIATQHEVIERQLDVLQNMTNALRSYDVFRKKTHTVTGHRPDDDEDDDELAAIEERIVTGAPIGLPPTSPSPQQRASAISKKRHCMHGKQRAHCRDCGGSIFCAHDKRKNLCALCGGSSMCVHGRRARECKSIECREGSMCKHRMIRRECPQCAASTAATTVQSSEWL